MTISDLQKEQSNLYWYINKVSKRIEYAPKGKLRISPYNGKTRFYHKITPNDRDGVYIPEKKNDLVRSLAQREYDELELTRLKELKGLVDCLLTFMEEHKPGDVYESLSPLRKELVTPVEVSDDKFASQWLALEYEKSIFDESTNSFRTAKGDYVSSESKAKIADMLFKAGVPYRQNYPVMLIDGSIQKPDFFILNMKTRTETVFEHFEKMDDSFCCNEALKGIIRYTESGYILGKNLLISFGTESEPLNTLYIKKLMESYFI